MRRQPGRARHWVTVEAASVGVVVIWTVSRTVDVLHRRRPRSPNVRQVIRPDGHPGEANRPPRLARCVRPQSSKRFSVEHCAVVAFTGRRPSEIMRYRPEHWNRTDHALTILTGRGGRRRRIPVAVDAETALHDLERLRALGPFSTSTGASRLAPGAGEAGHRRHPPLRRPATATAPRCVRSRVKPVSSRSCWATRP